ncbi:hypothetical protein FSP39_000396 [Pinctada imbricata]|uniref:Uncharacterized protein n=1 Tax=Pinctada imbricata TaxID=66713 RepID=A0AA88XP35_PINIB|nr:hypothetical protein FSP39_000396 [Pinctada imbricata]
MFQPFYPKSPQAPPLKEYENSSLPNGITVVTAYFKLGAFIKGRFHQFTTETYKNWMRSYGMLNNTVIAFTDVPEIKALLENERSRFPSEMTEVILVDRDKLWSFQLSDEIKLVFNQKGYPKHEPNTVNPYYSCAMHAKYDVLKYVIEKRMYRTRYLAWIDIGYFREEQKEPFTLLPPTLKSGHIAFTQVFSFYTNLTPRDIVYDNHVWIAGGFFIGEPQYLMLFIEDYRKSTMLMLSKKLMSTDQQVLYSMYVSAEEFRPRLPLQIFYHTCRCDWFYAGELCKDEFDKLIRPKKKWQIFYHHFM